MAYHYETSLEKRKFYNLLEKKKQIICNGVKKGRILYDSTYVRSLE